MGNHRLRIRRPGRREGPDPVAQSGNTRHEDPRRDAPAYAAYLVLLFRLLAFLTVQLHLDPALPPAHPSGEVHVTPAAAGLNPGVLDQ